VIRRNVVGTIPRFRRMLFLGCFGLSRHAFRNKENGENIDQALNIARPEVIF